MYRGYGVTFHDYGMMFDISSADTVGVAVGVFVEWPRLTMLLTIWSYTLRVVMGKIGSKPWE